MDADSSLRQGFTGKPGGGFVGMFQRNEYARYPRDIPSENNSAELVSCAGDSLQ